MKNQKKIKIYFLLLCCFGLTSTLFGQSGNTTNRTYQKTYAYGINLNTQQGLLGGVNFRYSKKITDKMYHSFSVEFVDIKDKKELRVINAAGGFYVPGKQNFLYAIRPQYGRELVLFHKAREKGVQVNLIGAIGPTLGIVSPYMIQYFDGSNTTVVAYDPTVHTSFGSIQGTGSLGESLSRARLHAGASFKSSLVFEYSSLRGSLIGMEIGFMADMFDKKITIMAFTEKKAFYSSAFLTLFYGIGK
jgi:hypothetical protein